MEGRSVDTKAFFSKLLLKPVWGTEVSLGTSLLLYSQRFNTQQKRIKPRALWETAYLSNSNHLNF